MISLTDPTVANFKKLAEDLFIGAGFENPSEEAVFLLSGFLKIGKTQIYLELKKNLHLDQLGKFLGMIERRKRREPAAYILGFHNFLGRDFKVDSRVLIPRPETEMLVEQATKLTSMGPQCEMNILDVGTGSGCIAISMAQITGNSVVALDQSDLALQVAKENAKAHGVYHRIRFIKSDLYKEIKEGYKGYFDMIISNPPYVSSSELNRLDPELNFEPQMALHGGPEGLDYLIPIINQGPLFLKRGGHILLEIGWDQANRVHEQMNEMGYQNIQKIKDIDGVERIMQGQWNGSV